MIEALAAALLLGGINTIADFVSSEMRLQAKPIYAFARIALICYCVGGIVGARAKQLMIGTIGGVMIGALVGGAYYFLAPSIGQQAALGVAWGLFWVSVQPARRDVARRRDLRRRLLSGCRWRRAHGRLLPRPEQHVAEVAVG